MGLIIWNLVFPATSTAIIVLYTILAGLSLTGYSIVIASFFPHSNPSGITAAIICTIVAIAAQVVIGPRLGTGAVEILSLVHMPVNFTLFFTYCARFQAENIPVDLLEVAPGSTWHLPGYVLWIYLIVQIILYPLIASLNKRLMYYSGKCASRKQKTT